MRGPILLRADATVRMGTGHVMRCIALAQASGTSCTFVSASSLPALDDRIRAEGFDIRHVASEPGSPSDAQGLGELAELVNASWIVIDGYHFSHVYQQSLKDAGFRLLAIDDYGHATHYCADLVVNPNPNADRSPYHIDEQSTKLLLGTRYALLRREFWDGSGERTFPERALRLLVTFGGSDSDNVTAIILRALASAGSEVEEIVVVVGSSNSHYASLLEYASAQPRISVIRDPLDMADLMRRADVAVSAAGGTSLELAAMGVPSLVVPIAENQIAVARSLHEERAAINLGPAVGLSLNVVSSAVAGLVLNRGQRVELSSNGRALVDGRGAQRVVEAMNDLRAVSDRRITIRNASYDDARILWEWANEPAVRAVSFSSEPIPWGDHVTWLSRKLADPACRLYVGVNQASVPVGQIRFDMHESAATLSITLDAKFRKRGYGTALLREGTRELFRTSGVESVHAFVKPDNESSLRVFRSAGFTEDGQQPVQGHAAVRFVLGRSTQC